MTGNWNLKWLDGHEMGLLESICERLYFLHEKNCQGVDEIHAKMGALLEFRGGGRRLPILDKILGEVAELYRQRIVISYQIVAVQRVAADTLKQGDIKGRQAAEEKEAELLRSMRQKYSQAAEILAATLHYLDKALAEETKRNLF